MKIYLASGNQNKKREMQELFPEHTVVIPSDEGLSFDPEETGLTFYENSLIKARALYDIVKNPVLADDSGICADALSGAPGIYSSRYAGPLFMKGSPNGKISQDEQNRMLIEQVAEAVKSGKLPSGEYRNGPYSAHYTCSMVLYAGNDRLFVAQETMEGSLIEDISLARGNGGFGYDPLFIPEGMTKTAAELTPEQKNAISHRGKAAEIIKKIAENVLF
ncbi:MAG: non-canonical purine NTP pyrophosphatase [Treponema sp.]|nr:non-canonical purine NTP pyrophosphatase [Treponema sp.]